jgi:hypothetical protein
VPIVLRRRDDIEAAPVSACAASPLAGFTPPAA